jgi:hypothetical protein
MAFDVHDNSRSRTTPSAQARSTPTSSQVRGERRILIIAI